MSPIHITSSEATRKQRYAAIRQIKRKKAFWRHVSVYTVLNLAFWTSWIISGLHERWIAPWPLLPTALWGALIIAHERRLGGRKAVSHDTIDAEVYQVTHPHEPIFTQRPIHQQIRYSDMSAAPPIRAFHWRDVIDARDAARIADDPEANAPSVAANADASTSS